MHHDHFVSLSICPISFPLISFGTISDIYAHNGSCTLKFVDFILKSFFIFAINSNTLFLLSLAESDLFHFFLSTIAAKEYNQNHSTYCFENFTECCQYIKHSFEPVIIIIKNSHVTFGGHFGSHMEYQKCL